jgi:hypothetical protein
MLSCNERAWMKSKLFFVQVHCISISSSSKWQFGGTLKVDRLVNGVLKTEAKFYQVGWTGAISTPITWRRSLVFARMWAGSIFEQTSAPGFASATSIAQIPVYIISVMLSFLYGEIKPVPVPRSKIRWGFFVRGARNSFFSRIIKHFACDMSILSSSCSSIGRPYSIGLLVGNLNLEHNGEYPHSQTTHMFCHTP